MSHEQVEHFRAFGFVVLRGLFTPDEAAALRAEVEGSLHDAYGPRYGTDEELGGIPGRYLPVMSDRTPLSGSLVADDPRLWQASHTLLGMATVPTHAEAVCYLGNAGWHTDLGPDVEGVTFLAYLEPRVAFDMHLLHSSAGGARRLAWSVEYLPFPGPGDRERCRIVRRLVVGSTDHAGQGYDHHRWPVWRDWAENSAGNHARDTAVTRLRILGVLDVAGADVGLPDWSQVH